MTKFTQKITSSNNQNFAIIQRGKGYSVVKQDCYCWKYVNAGKAPMSLQSAQNLLAVCAL
jgi:hypothetical protein